jgi:hypothetical protein
MCPATALANGAQVPVLHGPIGTACHFTSGPLAGTTGAYVSLEDKKLGSPCDNGKGSQGTVVAKPLAGIAGAPHEIPSQAPHETPHETHDHAAVPVHPPTAAPTPVPPVAPPIGGGAAPDPAVDANLTDAGIDEEFDQIVQQAKNGAIQYNVPPLMTVGQPVTIQVEISGANVPASALPAAETGTLAVTPLMEVDLSAPGSPGMFQIVPGALQSGQQLVPDNGKTDWVWTITPLRAGQQPGSLQIDAYMVLNAKLPNGQAITRQIKSYTVQVPVKAQSLSQTILSFLGKNWSTLAGFVVPSGAGLTFLLWFVSKKKTKRKAKVHSA